MTLTLNINNEEKLFVIGSFVPARVFRQAVQAQRILSKEDISEEDLDLVVGIVVNAFSNQFTIDELYDGLDARSFLSTITNTITTIINGVTNDTHR
ncbi:hypothetical protein PBV87_11495 [Niameybacter massiliensis]|uniref:Uncharacterized protein n=1 Tax=Holtiella tumoricola TaxID=3018743 RepID=A0AA42J139_9FIRM|nr:hypothetical protein [Holtiella tumoricola]MDA3732107.1 hypothetical protein [Holtiella tumoricola]